MKINLSEKIGIHLLRIERLAEEAELDADEGFSARAAAMNTLTSIIKELTKTQAEIVNMEHLLKTEQALIEAAKEIFPPEQYHIFTDKLKELLENA